MKHSQTSKTNQYQFHFLLGAFCLNPPTLMENSKVGGGVGLLVVSVLHPHHLGSQVMQVLIVVSFLAFHLYDLSSNPAGCNIWNGFAVPT